MPVTLHVSIIRVIENGKLFKQTLTFFEPIVFSQYTFYFALDKKDLVRKRYLQGKNEFRSWKDRNQENWFLYA